MRAQLLEAPSAHRSDERSQYANLQQRDHTSFKLVFLPEFADRHKFPRRLDFDNPSLTEFFNSLNETMCAIPPNHVDRILQRLPRLSAETRSFLSPGQGWLTR